MNNVNFLGYVNFVSTFTGTGETVKTHVNFNLGIPGASYDKDAKKATTGYIKCTKFDAPQWMIDQLTAAQEGKKMVSISGAIDFSSYQVEGEEKPRVSTTVKVTNMSFPNCPRLDATEEASVSSAPSAVDNLISDLTSSFPTP